ncbi:GNAT family N-acetyltransferase [Lacticaseibacillus kribbianus]|uniref:GNAT family N-acetyltransferase n=1 Tax=Lacticaseibacillus kribbianus TaxID=2926292 RepID=UPI001CD57D1F|nr:GNAT family protein [Lacticaseibacillus kribbianus]
MFMYPIDDELALALPRPVLDAPKLYALIDADRAAIARFLPWAADTKDAAGEQAFLTMTLAHFGQGKSVNLVIYYRGAPAGTISFNGFDDAGAATDLGYWLGEPFRGKGIMHRAVAAMCDLAFTEYGRNRVIIRAAVDNPASNAVASKAGFHLDGTLREGERLADGFHDVNEWSRLKSEWHN